MTSGFDLPVPAAVKAAAAGAANDGGGGGGGGGGRTIASAARAAAVRFWGSGLSCAFAAFLIFSLSAFAVKLTQGRVPVLEVCLVRSALSFTMSLVLIRSVGITPVFGHRRSAPLLAARGCCGAASMAAYYTSLQMLPLGDAVTIGARSPFMLLLKLLLLRRHAAARVPNANATAAAS